MPGGKLTEYLHGAEEAARAAGLHALKNIRRRRNLTQTFAHDVKLELDAECQSVAHRLLARRFPEHAFIGEESAPGKPRPPGPVWIVDPIDGTVNFFHGLPWWCCSVALQIDGLTVAGAVYAPALEEFYLATADGPARCNGRRLHTSDTDKLQNVIMSTGLNKRPRALPAAVQLFGCLAARTRKLRIMGSAALDICGVASGRVDAFFETGIYLWDVAAADLIVRRAGGSSAMIHRPGNRVEYLAAAPGVFTALRRLTGKVCPWPGSSVLKRKRHS
ncbi:MAG: inositol monophosphatase [Lentisphaerae bacterium]|nr:inositol monophosphatase [Lentisphaerota bacterium]